MGKRTMCVQSLTFFAQKALFSTQFFGVKTLDYKAVSSPQVSALTCAKGFMKIKPVV